MLVERELSLRPLTLTSTLNGCELDSKPCECDDTMIMPS